MADYTLALTGAAIDAALGFSLQGSVKSGLIYKQSGTAAVTFSFNVTSVTDTAQGEFNPAWTSAFADTFYISSGITDDPNNNATSAVFNVDGVTKTTAGLKYRTNVPTLTGGTDTTSDVHVIGDLA